jgi:hypothetical protein
MVCRSAFEIPYTCAFQNPVMGELKVVSCHLMLPPRPASAAAFTYAIGLSIGDLHLLGSAVNFGSRFIERFPSFPSLPSSNSKGLVEVLLPNGYRKDSRTRC